MFNDLDVLIVGAGISGLVLGHLLADTGLSVAVFEQDYSIPRNERFAGLVTSHDLRFLGIEEVKRLPVREIVTVRVHSELARKTDLANVDDIFAVAHDDLLQELRSQCGERGVPVVAGATAVELRWEDSVVTGAIAGPERAHVRSRLLVLADESDPRLAEAPGLRPDWPPTRLMHLARERYVGSGDVIRQSFGIGTGAVKCVHVGWTTAWGDPAEAYVVPAADSVTIGVNFLLEDEMASAHHVLEVLAELKTVPEIEALLSGLETGDVATEVVPMGHGSSAPRLVADGVMLVSDAVGATNPLNRDGLSGNLAVCAAAARTIRDALAAGDASTSRLAPYTSFLTEAVYRRGQGPLGQRECNRMGFLVQSTADVTSMAKSETLRGRLGSLVRAAARRSSR